jgi:hypothetical protein
MSDPVEVIARAETGFELYALLGVPLMVLAAGYALYRHARHDAASDPEGEGLMVGKGWQPIESAPRDETEILVCDARIAGGFHQVVSWDAENKNPGWHWATSDGPTFHQSAFTHWMRLPEPPEPR